MTDDSKKPRRMTVDEMAKADYEMCCEAALRWTTPKVYPPWVEIPEKAKDSWRRWHGGRG